MAIVKWSGLVHSIKGRIEGSVIRNNTYGAVLYSNNWSKRGYGPKHYENRFVVAALASQWRALSEQDRKCWYNQDDAVLGKKLITNPRPWKGSTRTNR